MKKLKYISNRVIFLSVIIFLLLLIQTIQQVHLLILNKIVFGQLLVYGAMPVIYLIVVWFWIVTPYRQSEELLEKCLEGHMLSEGQINKMALLTPAMKRQIEALDRIQKSPQLMDLNKRQAQYLALQNQINPHFLYNTLESIRGEALIAGLDSVADMTEALAKFFRYTITKVENLVTVEEELQNCETYFRIQQYRFGDRLKLHIECEEEEREEIMNCKIPKLTLQPILENSVIHGTELKVGTGNLKIAFERTQSRLIIRISDDGVGMDGETLAKLNSKLRCSRNDIGYAGEEEKGGIALVNVNNRIHLIFGEEYGMHIYSVPQKGTDVEITIPVKVNKKDLGSRGIKL